LFGTFFLSSFWFSVWENIVKKEGSKVESHKSKKKKKKNSKNDISHTTNLKGTDFPRVCEN